MHPTMEISGETIFFWYVTFPTVVLALAFALSQSQGLVARLRNGWKRVSHVLRAPAALGGTSAQSP